MIAPLRSSATQQEPSAELTEMDAGCLKPSVWDMMAPSGERCITLAPVAAQQEPSDEFTETAQGLPKGLRQASTTSSETAGAAGRQTRARSARVILRTFTLHDLRAVWSTGQNARFCAISLLDCSAG
jgi:hypothetical protein